MYLRYVEINSPRLTSHAQLRLLTLRLSAKNFTHKRMASRKKSKQRARRAAKAAEATLVAKVEAAGLFSPVPRKLTSVAANDEDARGPLFSLLQQLRLRNPNFRCSVNCASATPLPCTHGWDHSKYTSAEHKCNKFIEKALELFHYEQLQSSLEELLYKEYPKFWTDSVSLEWIAAACMSIGTELILQQGSNHFNNYLCIFSEFLTQCVARDVHKSQPLIYAARFHELARSDKRRLISYMKKRIPCSCLDAKYKEVRSLPKTGFCSYPHCGGKLKLSSLMSCEGCRKEHYCSKACQAADWSRHKEDCKIWKKWLADGGSSTSNQLE